MNYFGMDIHSTYHKVVGLTADGESLEFDIPNTPEGRERLQELIGEKDDAIARFSDQIANFLILS